MGPTPEGCIQLLSIRPLLTLAAWKVLDTIIDAALDEIPRQRKRDATGNPSYREITLKEKDARKWPKKERPLRADLWDALTMVYAETVELRHSLTHRRTSVDTNGTLIGHDGGGAPIRWLTIAEQEALGMAVLYASELLLTDRYDRRLLNLLHFQLGRLDRIHHKTISQVGSPNTPITVTVILKQDDAEPAMYVLDVPRVRNYPSLSGQGLIDLKIRPGDREDIEFYAFLEEAPDEIVKFNLDKPPAWFRS